MCVRMRNSADCSARVISVLAALVLCGCPAPTSSNDIGAAADLSVNAAMPDGGSTQVVIGMAGGTATSGDGSLKVTIPAGAMSADTTITIVPITSPAAGNVGQVFEIGPTGMSFAQPITLTFRYTATEITGHVPTELNVSTFANGSWLPSAASVVDPNADTVSATTTHLSPWGLTLSPASGSDMSGSGDVTSAHGAIHQFAINKILFPQVKTDYSIDLNGDGRVDNQLGNIMGAFASQGIDSQSVQDQLVASGQIVHLVAVQTADALLMTDQQVGATWSIGKPQSSPDFTGHGAFSVDTTAPQGATLGTLAGGVYASNNPATTTHPVSADVTIVFGGAGAVRLQLHGAYLRFTVSSGGLMTGQIDGSMKSADIQTTIVPAVAMSLTARITATDLGHACATNTDCKSSGMCTMSKCVLTDTAKQIQQIFDVGDSNGGNCTNPDGTLGVPNDGVISICEVSGNQLIANLLVPDVQIYDANGNYAPNPKNILKDSLSVGFGFTAVPATF